MSKKTKRSGHHWAATTRSGEPTLTAVRDGDDAWRLANRAAIWNATVPRGSSIRYFPEPQVPMKFVDTQTDSEAWALGADLVVTIVGVAGSVRCDHIVLRPAVSPFAKDVP